MNETAARSILLVRAIEITDAEHAVLTHEDRQFAGKAAAELARWTAAERHQPADAEHYLAQRARLLLEKLGERSRAVKRAAQALAWRPWIGVALPLAALIAGALFERIGDRGHVNVLAFPLLALILWNIAVYVLLIALPLARSARRAQDAALGVGPQAWLRHLAQRRPPHREGPLSPAVGLFVAEWVTLSGPLTAARISRTLHLSAAFFAVGAIAGLYLRGLVFDYRAGWESTFLDAPAVHAVLSSVLGPAARALGQPFPTAEALAALRFAPGSAGESAARWIHWYALTVAALVVLPRLLLAVFGAWRAHRLERAFPLDLASPYFRRLLGSFADGPAHLRVLPYSYTLEAPADRSLHAIARQLLGDGGELLLRPAVAFGNETQAAAGLAAGDSPDRKVALDLALFNLAATPEQENHGLFLDTLKAATAAPRAVLIDEAPYRHRLGTQAGAETRLAERREAWRAFATSRGWPITFADLAAPDLAQIERDLGTVLAQRA